MNIEVPFVRPSAHLSVGFGTPAYIYRPLDNPGASFTVSQLLCGPRCSNTPNPRVLPLLVCIASANAEAAGASPLGPDCTGH